MKKVVLLTGVLAAGFAATPVTAKAEVASAPQIHEGVIENATVATEKLLDLLNGLDYDLAALKKQIHDKSYSFVGMEDEAQGEAIEDIVNIATQIEKSRQEFSTLQAKFASNEITEEQFVKEVNEMIYHPVITREQAQKDLYDRYTHLDQDWKNFRAFQKKGDELWKTFTKFCNSDKNQGVDEIEDVLGLHEAVNKASEKYRTEYLSIHENRTKVWNHSSEFHTDGLKCLVEAEGDINDLYAKFVEAEKAYEDLVNEYYTAQEDLVGKINAEVAKWNATNSEDGKNTVNAAKKFAEDFVKTFNAANVNVWNTAKDGEDQKDPAFKNIKGYKDAAADKIAALKAAIEESNANETAYQKGLKAIEGSQKDLDAIKNEYYNTPKENVAGYVYRALIDGLQTKINNEKNGLVDAWNNWDFTVATDPVNAVEYVADKNFNKVKGEIADALKTIQENEAANKANHELAEAIDQHIQEMGLAVISWNHVHMDEYAADGVCEDGRDYWGTVTLLAEQAAFTDAEQKAYDDIKAKKYLDETAQGVKTNIDNNIELLWNHIATDQCEKSLEIVNKYYDDAHEANEALDPVCDEMGEFGLTPHCRCLPEDTKDNPCGWCDPTAKAEHDAIEAGYRANVDLLDKKHAETLAKTLVNDYIMYEESAKAAVDQWTADFEKAHNAHMEKLLAALHTSMDQVHALEHTAETAEHHLNSFTTGDRAAADAWVVEKGYAGVTNFAEYVNFLRENHELPGKVQTAFDEHHYNELVKLGADAYVLVQAADYTKAVEANKAAVDKVYAELKAIEASVPTIDANLVYEDDFNALSAKVDAIYAAIDAEQAAAQKAYDEGKAAEFGFTTNFGQLLNNLKADLATAQKLLADNQAAKAEKANEIANLEVLLNAVILDAKQIYNTEDHKDLAELEGMAEAIQTKIDNARVGLDTAFKNKVAPEFIIDVTIAADIEELKQAVSDFQEFKRQNIEKATLLYNDLTNLLTEVDALKKYGDVYEEGVAGGLDAYSIDRAIETLETSLKNDLNFLKGDLAAGTVVDGLAAYQEGLETYKADVADLKAQIADAEKFYAENLRALNNLEEHYRAVLSDLNEEEGNSKCEICDKEDDDTRDQLTSDLNDIFDDFTSNFNVEKNLNQIEVYADFEKQLNDIEAGVKELKKSHEDHYDLVKTSQKAADNILDKLFDFNELFWGLEATPGYENFKERTDHCSNPDVLYVNELKGELQNLKETVAYDNSHEGGHAAFENYNVYLKWIAQLKTSIEKTKAAIQANEAAKVILDAQFEEVAGLVNDALEFWEDNYMPETQVQLEEIIAYWTGTPAGEKGKLQEMYEAILDKYQHGAAAYDWTVDHVGAELTQNVKDDVDLQKQNIEMHRNTAANFEAINHEDKVEAAMDALVAAVKADVTEGDMVDPFVKELYADFLALVGEYAVANEGLYGVLAQIEANRNEHYLAGDLEAALNIDEASKIKGIHQMLNELAQNAETLVATYNDLFEHAHHLTNGKTLYSDMQYVTIGFFRQANEGLGEQATEMFKEVELHFDAAAGNIGIYDTNWLNVLDWEDVNDTPDNMFDDVPAAYERDFAGHLVHQDGLGEIPAKVGVLGHGDKKNELTFTLNDEQDYVNAEIRTLAAGAADITFKPGSLTVDGWTTKHNVYIEVNVETPQEEVAETDVMTGSNKLIVRLDNPIDLTYTINSLVARTNDGTEFSYADRVINYAANTLEFNLPEGTTSVELPEGFFTFRTGENTIARSAAMVVTVGGTTTIEGLIAMGEKAQIFDLQGRRVKAEALISGNTYVVNGEKVMVK